MSHLAPLYQAIGKVPNQLLELRVLLHRIGEKLVLADPKNAELLKLSVRHLTDAELLLKQVE